MDPDTAKFVAIISGTFTLLGGGITATVAAVVNYIFARQNRKTQLALAPKVARHEWHREQLVGLLATTGEQMGLYDRVKIALVQHDRSQAENLLQLLTDVGQDGPARAATAPGRHAMHRPHGDPAGRLVRARRVGRE